MRITSLLLYNLGLPLVHMSTSALLSTASPVFSFLFGLGFFREKFSGRAATGVLFAVAGTAVTLSDENKGSRAPVLGGVLILSSCAMCSLASCLLSRWLKNEKYVNDILGIYGLIALGLSGPVLAVCHAAQWEKFHWPSGQTLAVMSLNALLGNVTTNLLMGVAVVILGPVMVAVGLTSQVLMAAVVDHFKENVDFGPRQCGSAVLIVAAVVLVAVGQRTARDGAAPVIEDQKQTQLPDDVL